MTSSAHGTCSAPLLIAQKRRDRDRLPDCLHLYADAAVLCTKVGTYICCGAGEQPCKGSFEVDGFCCPFGDTCYNPFYNSLPGEEAFAVWNDGFSLVLICNLWWCQ